MKEYLHTYDLISSQLSKLEISKDHCYFIRNTFKTNFTDGPGPIFAKRFQLKMGATFKNYSKILEDKKLHIH